MSNVDKRSVEGELLVRLCNYTDVYYRDSIDPEQNFTEATASPDQVALFRVKRDDVIITKDSETADDIGIPAYVVEGASDLVCGYHLAMIRPVPIAVDGWFLYWALASEATRSQFEVAATGITRFGLRSDSIGGVIISTPPAKIQRLIADFLDAETARIDALIAGKRAILGLLSERWQALVRSTYARLAGDRVKIRHLCDIKRGQSPRPIADPVYFDPDGEFGWVRIEDVSSQGMHLRRTRQRLSDLGVSRSVKALPGTVLVSISASIGKPVIVDTPCCYHDGFVGLHNLRALPEYVYHYVGLPEVFGGLGRTGTQENINSDILGDVRIPYVALSEQRRVIRELENQREVGNHCQRFIGKQIELLKERRRSLITAAVTGQMEVPGVGAG